MANPRANTQKSQTSGPGTVPGRMLLPDPAGPISLFPLRVGGPLRFRELTEEEIWLWHRRCEVVLAGGQWTDDQAALYRDHYRQALEAASAARTQPESPQPESRINFGN